MSSDSGKLFSSFVKIVLVKIYVCSPKAMFVSERTGVILTILVSLAENY